MGIMDTISLDDTADSSLFIIDEMPLTENTSSKRTGRKRKSGEKQKKGGKAKMKKFVVMGGSVPENPSKNMRLEISKNMEKPVETIVIDDEESVIELSDDEVCFVGQVCGSRVGSSSGESRLGSCSGNVTRLAHGPQERLQIYQCSSNRRPKKTPLTRKRSPVNPTSSCQNDSLNLPTICPEKASSDNKIEKRKLRPIVIDGSNVAFGHGDSRRQFSSKGIQLCVDYFRQRGHTVKVFVPQFRRRHPATLDTHILDKLEEEKVMVYTPSRRVDGKQLVSYDDRMMVEYAAQCGAVIVTRDNLRDVAAESDTFKKVVTERILMFTWVDDEVIMFPQDPLGRDGPVLSEFLSFPLEDTEKKSDDNDQEKKSIDNNQEKRPS